MVSTENEDVIFTLTATGPTHDQFTYQWVKEKGGVMSVVADEQHIPNLTIPAVKSYDSGLYYCIVKNKWNMTEKSHMAFLKVICTCTYICKSSVQLFQMLVFKYTKHNTLTC